MIRIRLLTKSGRYVGFTSDGHAGYANAGHDIVCSAVSALMINTVNSIEAFTDDHFEVDEDDGHLSFRLKGNAGEKSLLLLDSLALGLRSIGETYGNSFLDIGEKKANDKGGA